MRVVIESLSTSVQLRSIELELTGACQLQCSHCFASSSPQGTHGTMTRQDWLTLISEAAVLGVPQIQLLGGEPTAYPHWVELTKYALSLGLKVEIYSNLYAVQSHWWDVLGHKGASLATSYYSDDPTEHDQITKRPGSHQRTRGNIRKSVQRGIPVRVGIVEVHPRQRIEQARQELAELGVVHIRVDRQRAIGRAAGGATPDPSELCGRCGTGRVAVLPDGSVAPCVMSRFMACGNVKEQPLAEVLVGPQWRAAIARIPARAGNPCDPDCNPASDGSDCSPAEQTACDPAYADIPDKK
ncbi:radical SAM protein [Streptomyces sp. NPDC001262]|uniref:radical SAM protein n=1 Tax=Streptomyces sp. NPDC001262 TaxID=3364552 RepID=UPI0036CABBA0